MAVTFAIGYSANALVNSSPVARTLMEEDPLLMYIQRAHSQLTKRQQFMVTGEYTLMKT